MLKAGGEAKRRELVHQMEDMHIEDKTKMTDEEEYKGKFGDYGQADGLMNKKRNFK